MKKEVVKKEPTTTAVALPMEDMSWGSEDIDPNDFIAPKLLLMQGLSKLVASRKAQQGDIVKSTTGEIVGNDTKPVEFMPLNTYKTWKLEELVNGKYEYKGLEPFTADNCSAPYEYTKNGTQWRRIETLNFNVLLVADVEKEKAAFKKYKTDGTMPNPSDALIPCHLSFGMTGYRAGKEIISEFTKAKKMRIPPASMILQLGCRLEKNDKGSFYVYTVSNSGRTTSPEDLKTCKDWYDVIKSGRVKGHDTDLEEEDVKPKAAAPVQTRAQVEMTDDELPF